MMMTDEDGGCPVDSASAVSIFSTASILSTSSNGEEKKEKKCHHRQNDYYHCQDNHQHQQQQQPLMASSSSSSSSSPSPIPSPLEESALGNTITVTTSLDDAATQIVEHSFAIYKVNSTTQSQIQLAWDQAKSFLDYDNNDDDGCTTTTTTTSAAAAAADNNDGFENLLIQKYRTIVNGHLMGFNIPSKSKRLFRCFCCGCSNNDANNNQQPWPSSHEFKPSSQKLSMSLHNILMECYNHIITKVEDEKRKNVAINDDDDNNHDFDFDFDCDEPIRKRPRHNKNNELLLSSSSMEYPQEQQQQQQQISSNNNNNNNNSNCPLDYFFYHNQYPTENNCTIHTDRGLLICVCLTDVPGLMVQSCSKTKQWYCPEQLLIANSRLYKEIYHPTSDGYICIMSGDQLINQLNNDNNKHHTQNYHSQSSSCIHYVKNNLKRARLSISYELRI